MGNRKIIIWVIDHGLPGHSAQTRGMIELLRGQGLDLEVHLLEVRVRLRGWQRGFMRVLLTIVPTSWGYRLVRSFHDDFAEPAGPVDVVLTSGGTGMWLLHLLGKRHKALRLYAGYSEAFPASWYDLVVSPLRGALQVPTLESPRLMTSVSAQACDEAARSAGYQVRAPQCVAVLIGGPSRSHSFEKADWQALAKSLNSLGEKGYRFLLTTSRRTGSAAESVLQEEIDPKYLMEAVWWSEAPRKVIAQFLGRSEMVLVTRDSLTMVSEAIDSGRPTFGIRSTRVEMPEEGFLSRYYEKLFQQGSFRTVTCDEVAELAPFAVPSEEAAWESTARELTSQILKSLES